MNVWHVIDPHLLQKCGTNPLGNVGRLNGYTIQSLMIMNEKIFGLKSRPGKFRMRPAVHHPCALSGNPAREAQRENTQKNDQERFVNHYVYMYVILAEKVSLSLNFLVTHG